MVRLFSSSRINSNDSLKFGWSAKIVKTANKSVISPQINHPTLYYWLICIFQTPSKNFTFGYIIRNVKRIAWRLAKVAADCRHSNIRTPKLVNEIDGGVIITSLPQIILGSIEMRKPPELLDRITSKRWKKLVIWVSSSLIEFRREYSVNRRRGLRILIKFQKLSLSSRRF